MTALTTLYNRCFHSINDSSRLLGSIFFGGIPEDGYGEDFDIGYASAGKGENAPTS